MFHIQYHIIFSSCLHLLHIFWYVYVCALWQAAYSRRFTAAWDFSQIGKRMTEGQHAFGIVVGISKKIFILVREVNILYKRNLGLINPMNGAKKAHIRHRSIQVYYYSITIFRNIQPKLFYYIFKCLTSSLNCKNKRYS